MECLADCHKRNLNMRESLLSNPVKKYRCILTSGLFTYTYIVTLRRVIMSDLDRTHSSYVARWRIKKYLVRVRSVTCTWYDQTDIVSLTSILSEKVRVYPLFQQLLNLFGCPRIDVLYQLTLVCLKEERGGTSRDRGGGWEDGDSYWELRCNLKPDVCANVHSAAIACMDGGVHIVPCGESEEKEGMEGGNIVPHGEGKEKEGLEGGRGRGKLPAWRKHTCPPYSVRLSPWCWPWLWPFLWGRPAGNNLSSCTSSAHA